MIIFVIILAVVVLFWMYNLDVTFYGPRHCIQRLFGYNDFYDRLADIFLNIENRTIYYTYKNKNWRIELWKGNYGLFFGGEVGIYNKDLNRIKPHYNSATDEEMIYMSMEIYHNDKILITRPYNRYWWINGFKFRFLKKISNDELRLHTTLTFNDIESRDAFIRAYINSYDSATIKFSSIDGNNMVEINF